MIIKEYEWWKSWGWSCRQERIALIEWYLGFYCFTVGMLCDDRLYISSFISGAVHAFKSLEIQSSMSQLPETACAIFSPPHSCHVGVHWIWATRRNGTTDSFILFYVNLEMDGSCGFIRTLTQPYRRLRGRQTRIFQLSSTMRGGKPADAALPPLSSAVKWIFQLSSAPRGGKPAVAALPPLSSAVKSTFQFSSAQRGGKLAIAALPPLSSAVKSIFQFSSALRGGKLEIAFTLRAHMAEAFQSDFLSSFYSLLLLLGGSWVGA